MSRRRPTALVWGVALFAATQLAMNVVIDTVRPHWRDPEAAIRSRAVADSPRPYLVALGSSRTQMGLDPDSLGLPESAGGCYNLAQAGGRLPTQLVTLRRLVRAGVRPRVVLVEILPAALGDDRPFEARLEVGTLSARDLIAVLPECADRAGTVKAWLSWRAVPVRSYRFHLLSDIGLGRYLPTGVRSDFHKKQTRPSGWMPYFYEAVTPEQRQASTARSRAEYAPQLARLTVTAESRRLLETIADEAEAAGARVAFVVMPESPEFQGWYAPESRRAVAALLAELAGSTRRGVFDLQSPGLAEADFADGHHPLRGAARRLSREFGTTRLTPWLQKCPGPAGEQTPVRPPDGG